MAVAAGPGGPDSAWERRGLGAIMALGTAGPTARDLTGLGNGMTGRPAGTANGAPAGAPFPDTSGPRYQACTSSCRAGHRAAAPPLGAGRLLPCLPRPASRGWSRVGSRFAVSGRESVTPFYDGSAVEHSPRRHQFVISIDSPAHIARGGRVAPPLGAPGAATGSGAPLAGKVGQQLSPAGRSLSRRPADGSGPSHARARAEIADRRPTGGKPPGHGRRSWR